MNNHDEVIAGVVTDKGNFVDAAVLSSKGFIFERSENGGIIFEYIGGSKNDDSEDSIVSGSKRVDETGQQFDYSYSADNVIEPPWNFTLLKALLVTNAIHGTCISSKAEDYALNGWKLRKRDSVISGIEDHSVSEEIVDADYAATIEFLETCYDGLPIEFLCRDLALDYEGLGWFACEVRRTITGKVRLLNPIDTSSLRIINEVRAKESNVFASYIQKKDENKKVFFSKFNSMIRFNGLPQTFDPSISHFSEFPKTQEERERVIEFDPENIIGYADGKLLGEDAPFDKYANDLIVFNRRPFTSSPYYGTPSGIQALPHMLAQQRISEYNLHFFSSKGVPQYAVVIEGVSPNVATQVVGTSADGEGEVKTQQDLIREVQKTVETYFTRHLTSNRRSILVLTGYGDAKIRFERLSSETIEASFDEYEKRCTRLICVANRVPEHLIGITEAANLGGGRDTAQIERYRDHIISPGQRVFESFVNKIIREGMLVPWFNFDFDPMPVSQTNEELSFALDAFVAGGISLNQFLERIGEQRLREETGADAYYIRTSNVTAINQALDNALAAANIAKSRQDELVRSIASLVEERVEKDESTDAKKSLVKRIEKIRGKFGTG